MLTYDAVLRTQDRLLNPENYPITETTAAEYFFHPELLLEDIQMPEFKIPEPIIQLTKAMRSVVEKLIGLVGKAFNAFGIFLKEMLAESREVAGNASKTIDKFINIKGMKIRGYPFSGLNNQVSTSYKRINLDEFLKKLGIPKIETWEDVQKYREQNQTNMNDQFATMTDSKLFARIIDYMIGMKIAEAPVDQMYNEMMFKLWGSKDPIILEAEKDFTVGGELKKLVSPPLAKSILLSYKHLQKKLYNTRRLIPNLTKPGTLAHASSKVLSTVEKNVAKSDRYAKSFGLSNEDSEKMKNDLKWEAAFMRYYVSTLRLIASNMNRLNKALITTVKAQNQQSKFIIRKAMTYETNEHKVAKDTKKSEQKFNADKMNAYTSEHRNPEKGVANRNDQ